MYRGFVLAAAALGSSLGLGLFATCYSPFLSSRFLSIFSYSISKGIKSKKISKKVNDYKYV